MPLVLVARGDEIAHRLEVKRSATSRAKVVKLDGKRSFVREKAFSRVNLCLEKGTGPVYRGGSPPVPEVKEMASKNSELSSSIKSIGKRREKPRRAVREAGKTGHMEMRLKRRMKKR